MVAHHILHWYHTKQMDGHLILKVIYFLLRSVYWYMYALNNCKKSFEEVARRQKMIWDRKKRRETRFSKHYIEKYWLSLILTQQKPAVISSVGSSLTPDKDHSASSLEYHRHWFILKISDTKKKLLTNLSRMISSTFSTR